MKFVFLVLQIIAVLLGGALQFSTQQPTTTANPECIGMDKAVRQAQKAMARIPGIENPRCSRNNHCSGISCTATLRKKKLKMNIELRQCDKPISAHVDFTYGKQDFHKNVSSGHRYEIYDNPPLKLYVKVLLKRTGNVVMTVVKLESQLCASSILCSPPTDYELVNQNFTVVMKNCPGYSPGTPVPYTGTRLSTVTRKASVSPTKTTTRTGHPAYSHTKKMTATRQPYSVTKTPGHSAAGSTPKMTSTRNPPTTENLKHSTTGSTRQMTYTTRPTTKKSSSTSKEPIHAKQKGGKKSSLTSGAIAGIAVGCIMAVLVLLGVFIYYKKCYRRSRLRAAYYNDISMNDPLYDDFGPEIA